MAPSGILPVAFTVLLSLASASRCKPNPYSASNTYPVRSATLKPNSTVAVSSSAQSQTVSLDKSIVVASQAANVDTSGVATFSACQALKVAGLESLLLYPTDSEYVLREESYWSSLARLNPSCIVQPRTNTDVSKILKVLSASSGNFAVRSGGHSQWSGGSDISNGVTIDMGLMTAATYDSKSQLIKVQPGLNWVGVYNFAQSKGRGVVGGRESTVGIGGFLTGGGNSYFSGQYGFACDTIANFEVVLATGQIVNANKDSNPDLWKALKGGSGNFGIVTRFDLQSFPATNVWGGMSVYSNNYTDQLLKGLVDFTSDNKNHPEDAYIGIFQYDPAASPDVLTASSMVDTKAVVDAPAFAKLQAIPALQADLQVRTMSNLASAFVLPANQSNIWFTTTFKNDLSVVKRVTQLHEALIADLKTSLGAANFATRCLFQPLPAFFADISVQQGGNVLGLDVEDDDMILWLGNGVVYNQGDVAAMQTKMAKWTRDIDSFAKVNGADIQFKYLNYADGSQNPLASYGTSNVNFIKKVAAKYDPLQTFQKKVPGGFKISRA